MAIPADSVGLVEPRQADFPTGIELACGRRLPAFELVYETYGELNPARSNAVLICHALSGNHHAAGRHAEDDAKPGWWEACIGPGKAIDTNRFFVVSLNNLGGCHGSTGPLSTGPDGERYGPGFPTVTVPDWVRSQAILADHLGIERFAAIVGGSLGGMQAMQWAIDYPERVGAAVLTDEDVRSRPELVFYVLVRQSMLERGVDDRESADYVANCGAHCLTIYEFTHISAK